MEIQREFSMPYEVLKPSLASIFFFFSHRFGPHLNAPRRSVNVRTKYYQFQTRPSSFDIPYDSLVSPFFTRVEV